MDGSRLRVLTPAVDGLKGSRGPTKLRGVDDDAAQDADEGAAPLLRGRGVRGGRRTQV